MLDVIISKRKEEVQKELRKTEAKVRELQDMLLIEETNLNILYDEYHELNQE